MLFLLVAVSAYCSTLGAALLAPSLATLALTTRAFVFVGAACLLPAFSGSWVFAAGLSELTSLIGARDKLLLGSEGLRVSALVIASCLKTVPLCAFLLATATLPDQARRSSYIEGNSLNSTFRLATALRQYPLVTLIGCAVIAASAAALDPAVPTLLFRSNPGTPPETLEILLSREYREKYGAIGVRALPTVAKLGAAYASLIVTLAVCMALLVALQVRSMGRFLLRHPAFAGTVARLLSARLSTLPLVLPAATLITFGITRRGLDIDTSYTGTLAVAFLVALVCTWVAFGIATILRYNSRLVATSRRLRNVAIALVLLTSVPSSCYLLVLRLWPQSMSMQWSSYLIMIGALVLQMMPIALFFAVSVFLGASQHRVEWIRATQFRAIWLCWTEGYIGQRPANAAVMGYCFTAIATGTSLLAWFSHLAPSPSEHFVIAVLGRRTNDGMAGMLAVVALVVACTASSALAWSYSRSLPSWKNG